MDIENMAQDEKTDLIVDLIASGAMCGILEHYQTVLNTLRNAAVSDALDLSFDNMQDAARILKNLANAIGIAEQVIS